MTFVKILLCAVLLTILVSRL